MSETLHDALAPVIERWTIGGPAAALVEDDLRALLGDDPDEAELRLLAVAGPALATLVVPAPAGALAGVPELPALPLPTLPDRLRPIAARVLGKAGEALRNGLLDLVERRGYVVHPADWLPARTGEVPTIYAPWQDWVNGIAPAPVIRGMPVSWSDLGTAGRRALLLQTRRDDPGAGLALVRSHIVGEPADVRHWMVGALATGLNGGDREFLQSLAADRAPRIKQQVARLLARLGSVTAPADGDEDPRTQIPDFLRVETAILTGRRKGIVQLRPRNQVEVQRRHRMMADLDAATLAQTLAVTEEELPGLWPWGADSGMDAQFGEMLLETGSDAVVHAFGRAIVAGARVEPHVVATGARRLAEDALRRIANDALTAGAASEQLLSRLPVAGVVDEYRVTPTWQRILRGVEDIDHPAAHTEDLHALGVLVTRDAANDIIATLTSRGMPGADPRLDTLRINAAI